MPAYQPFWCEENIWHLAADPGVGPGDRLVLLISCASGHVACWNQGVAAEGEPVLWDYHVVLAVRDGTWCIWDLDTRLGSPVSAARWLAGTFPHGAAVREEFAPRFLPLPAADYRRDLRSDRAHMRTAAGGWRKPPPPWPAPDSGSVSLGEYLTRTREGIGLEGLATLFSR